LPSPSGGEGIIAGSSPLRGEGWERVKCQYYFETVNKYWKEYCKRGREGNPLVRLYTNTVISKAACMSFPLAGSPQRLAGARILLEERCRTSRHDRNRPLMRFYL
jgi:hypothetical protein